MAISGKFNTDAGALAKRIHCHDAFGSNDLNQWIFRNLSLCAGASVLDVGCGTGKQSLLIAKIVGKSGKVHSTDVSKEALDILEKEASNLGLAKRISLSCCRHGDIHSYIKENTYDRVVSSYSLYYAENPEYVIKTLWDAIHPGGILFFCGPSNGNNDELKSFHYSLAGVSVSVDSQASNFMEGAGQRITRQFFNEVDIVNFENPLQFDSAESLYTYWSSYNLYEEKLDNIFRKAATEYFSKSSFFVTTKRVIGVRAVK